MTAHEVIETSTSNMLSRYFNSSRKQLTTMELAFLAAAQNAERQNKPASSKVK